MTRRPRSNWNEAPAERVEQRIAIERDGTVTARSGKVEYGQGIRAGFAKIVAEELDVPLERVRVELGETDSVPWDMGTFGSMSTAVDGASLRAAAAEARALLIGRAAVLLGAEPASLTTRDGYVRAKNRKKASYAELTADAPLAGLVPDEPSAPRAPRGAEDAPLRLGAADIVTGRARYAADIRLPGMLRGHVLHAPLPDARLAALDERRARALPGVVDIVRDGDFVGVLAERDEAALAGVLALEAEWVPAAPVRSTPVKVALRADKGVDAALDRGAHRLKAHYHLPHIAHASIGPSAAVADVRADGADFYVATQGPFGLRDEMAELLGLPAEKIHIHPQAMSGMYGRGNADDAVSDAARLSRAAGRPVLVQWTRAEEFRLSPARPLLGADLEGALDASGAIIAWRDRILTNPHGYGSWAGSERMVAMTSGRNAEPPYALGRAQIQLEVSPGDIRSGSYRSLGAAPNVFAIESFIDELAHASGQDPIDFRLRHIDDERLGRVLGEVAERSHWFDKKKGTGRGLGVACAVYHGTYVAQVAEVSLTTAGKVRLERVWCAVDAGRLVHPDGARNQIEGGIQQAASWTLLEELTARDGRVIAATWRDYPIATFADAPAAIEVVFVDEGNLPSTGIGEPGSVPTAAAIANAVFDRCGTRVRDLPIRKVGR